MTSRLWIAVQLLMISIFHGSNGIHNGEVADYNKFKYMAYIYAFSGEYAGACGGVIIDELYILTAAHCVQGVEPSETFVFVGTTHLNRSLNAMREVKDIHMHPNYSSGKQTSCTISAMRSLLPCVFGRPEISVSLRNDIAVLKLSQVLPLGENLSKVGLPQTDSLPYCKELEYAGWGEMEDSLQPMELQYTRIIILDPEECERHHALHRSKQFCAITTNRISSLAYGDSGGPVVNDNIVYGITSFAYLDAPLIPVVFTNVFLHKDFIMDSMEDDEFQR